MNEIKKPYTYLITKGNLTVDNFPNASAKTLQIIKLAVLSKITLIQIREKHIPARLIFNLASRALELTKNTETKILINDRLDIAITVKADGVHLTSNSIPTNIVRQIVPANFIVGVSTHSLEKAQKAKECRADFVTYSPIFPTSSKIDYGQVKGLKNLQNVSRKLGKFPVIALGGINKLNYRFVIKSGASGFAGISFLNDESNLKKLRYE